MNGPRVLVVGDVMRDIIVRPAGPLRRGTDQRATIRTSHGGSAANQAAWLARFGVPVRFVGCVAEDDRAAQAGRLRHHGVEPVLAGHPVLPTGTLVALVEQDGERSFLTDRGANDGLVRDDLPGGLLDGVEHLHLSGYALVGDVTRAAALALLDEAREAGIAVSFDPGSAGYMADLGVDRVLGWIGAADLCVANADEAAVLTGATDADAQLSALNARFDLVVLKQGAAGARARWRGEEWQASAPAVDVIDTTGAGDVFFAAFLAARLAGEPIDVCLGRAVEAGAHAVTIIGGWPVG